MSNKIESQSIQKSIRFLQIVVIIGIIILLGAVFKLQILDYEKYSPVSKQNSIRQQVVNASRGLILDRNQQILVDNQPIFSINIIPANFERKNIPLLAELLNLDEEVIVDRLNEAQQYSWYRPSRLVTEVSFSEFSNIQENLWQLPGITQQIESKRNYPSGLLASHIFGYLREASEKEYRESDILRLGDKVGKSGIEFTYEEFLRGDAGIDYIRVNAYGQALGLYDEGNMDIPPTKGADLITSIDAGLQQLTEELMKNKKGAAVAMNPQTGEILSMTSAPQFDVRKLAGRIDQQYWQEVNTDSLTPLFNRAISSRQPPGSTFKPIMGIIGLHLGIVTPETEIYNSGAFYRGRAYRDLAEVGDYNLRKAIGKSSNTYFFWMMNQIANRGELNIWSRLVKDFGLGVPNRIDLPFERNGIIPDSTYLNQTFGERRWGTGDLISLGVGQGLVSVSPLQMAVATSVIANGGYRVQPHVVKYIREPDGELRFTNPEKTKIEWIKPEYLGAVKQGMRDVVLTGSGRFYANLDTIAVAGKTGTAQNPHGENHGWFVAYAPFENPEIVVAVLMENSGFGSISAAPVASLLIEKYLTGAVNRTHVYNYVLNFKPKLRIEQNATEIEAEQ
ncbi:MAG: penicillin-binding protein 2 [Balneolaceae bacterium]